MVLSRILGLADTAKRLVRSVGLRVLDDVARRGELAGIARRVGDVNVRLAAMEPHGPVQPRACGVCDGPVHTVARGLSVVRGGVALRCTLGRCARCWALRPEYTLDAPGAGGDASGVPS